MNESEIVEYLKTHLSVRFNRVWEWDGSSLQVDLVLNNEVISSDSVYVPGESE